MDFPIASSESLAGLRFATVGAKQTATSTPLRLRFLLRTRKTILRKIVNYSKRNK